MPVLIYVEQWSDLQLRLASLLVTPSFQLFKHGDSKFNVARGKSTVDSDPDT